MAWSEIEPRYVFHGMNAFDEGEDVVVDLVEYDSAPLFPRADGDPPAPPGGRLARWRVDPGGKRPVRGEVLDGAPGEFPRIDDRRAGLRYRYGYRVSPLGGPQSPEAIVVHDLVAGTRRVFQPAEDGRPGEAVFVPAASDAPEGEGFLLTVVYRPVRDDSALVFFVSPEIECHLIFGGRLAAELLKIPTASRPTPRSKPPGGSPCHRVQRARRAVRIRQRALRQRWRREQSQDGREPEIQFENGDWQGASGWLWAAARQARAPGAMRRSVSPRRPDSSNASQRC